MSISGNGWELHINRLGLHEADSKSRTYSSYQVYLNGAPVDALNGFMCECIGPGDNQRENNGKRIEQGVYPLWTQFGRYRTLGYSTNMQVAGTEPMPGLALAGTGKRTAILIHPAHPPHPLFVQRWMHQSNRGSWT